MGETPVHPKRGLRSTCAQRQEAIGESEVRWSVQHWEQWTDEVRKSADWGINHILYLLYIIYYIISYLYIISYQPYHINHISYPIFINYLLYQYIIIIINIYGYDIIDISYIIFIISIYYISYPLILYSIIIQPSNHSKKMSENIGFV